jgi:hypothetical protein
VHFVFDQQWKEKFLGSKITIFIWEIFVLFLMSFSLRLIFEDVKYILIYFILEKKIVLSFKL